MIPSHGDKVYRCFDGTLEVVTFLERSPISDIPGYTGEWWICKEKDGRKFQCSCDMYVTTIKEAYEKFLKECGEALPRFEEEVNKSVRALIDLTKLIMKIEFELDKVK